MCRVVVVDPANGAVVDVVTGRAELNGEAATAFIDVTTDEDEVEVVVDVAAACPATTAAAVGNTTTGDVALR